MTLIVDQDQWTDLRTGEVGEIDQGTRDRISAEFVGRGRALPRASRADIAKALEGNAAALEPIVPELLARTASMRADDLADEAGWVLHTIDQFQRHAVPLGDQPAARLVAALTLPPVRDLVLAEHSRDNAETMSSLWRDLTRRTPRAQLGPVAELLAFSSWLAGNGAEAWVALDLIEQAPARPLAGLVSTALQVAAPPQMWDEARPTSQASRARSTLTSVGPSIRDALHPGRPAHLATLHRRQQPAPRDREAERQLGALAHSRGPAHSRCLGDVLARVSSLDREPRAALPPRNCLASTRTAVDLAVAERHIGLSRFRRHLRGNERLDKVVQVGGADASAPANSNGANASISDELVKLRPADPQLGRRFRDPQQECVHGCSSLSI